MADRYRLIEPVGQGGMGRVWRAHDEVLHRQVALKELLPPHGLSAEEWQELYTRSIREARVIARLDHPNIVRVFDVAHDNGGPWIVMEFVPSRSLAQVLSTDGPTSPQRAARIGLDVLRALRAAHQSGVLHRDVKPANLLLAGEERVVLTDFGLATLPEHPAVTRAGLILGSPAYIAPERALKGIATPEGDLWSLGATLYAAVEGRSHYARDSAMATVTALATEPPDPPKQAGQLEPVLAGLLRKDPAERISPEQTEQLLLCAAGDHDCSRPIVMDRDRHAQAPSSSLPSQPREAARPPAPAQPEPSAGPPPAPAPVTPTPVSKATAVASAAPQQQPRPGVGLRTAVVAGVVSAAVAAGVLLAALTVFRPDNTPARPGSQALPGLAGSRPTPTQTLRPPASPVPPHIGLPAPGVAGNTSTRRPTPAIKHAPASAQPAGTSPGIVNDMSGLCLGISGSSELSGAPAVVEACRGSRTQTWRIRNYVFLNGHEYDQFQNDVGFCLIVSGASSAGGAAVVQGECNGPDDHSQFWYAVYDSPNARNASHLQNGHSGLFMDTGASTSSGAPVVQSSYSTSSRQYWRTG